MKQSIILVLFTVVAMGPATCREPAQDSKQNSYYGDADLKSSSLYENLPVQTKMAILSRRPILLAILLYEQFIYLTQNTLRPNIQFLSTQQQAYQSFLVTTGLIPFASL